jgi:hypothetical protein
MSKIIAPTRANAAPAGPKPKAAGTAAAPRRNERHAFEELEQSFWQTLFGAGGGAAGDAAGAGAPGRPRSRGGSRPGSRGSGRPGEGPARPSSRAARALERAAGTALAPEPFNAAAAAPPPPPVALPPPLALEELRALAAAAAREAGPTAQASGPASAYAAAKRSAWPPSGSAAAAAAAPPGGAAGNKAPTAPSAKPLYAPGSAQAVAAAADKAAAAASAPPRPPRGALESLPLFADDADGGYGATTHAQQDVGPAGAWCARQRAFSKPPARPHASTHACTHSPRASARNSPPKHGQTARNLPAARWNSSVYVNPGAEPSPMEDLQRVVANVVLVLTQLISPNLSMAKLSIMHLGGGAKTLLTPAAYAAVLWNVIYVGCFLYALYQTPMRAREAPLLRRLGWYTAGAFAATSAWAALVSLADRGPEVPASFVIVTEGAAPLAWAIAACTGLTWALLSLVMKGLAEHVHPFTLGEHLFVVAPLSLYAGWVTILTAINYGAAMLASGATIISVLSPHRAVAGGLVAVAGVTAVAECLSARGNPWYAAGAAWGLIGIASANWRFDAGRNVLSEAGNLGAVCVICASALRVASLRRRKWRIPWGAGKPLSLRLRTAAARGNLGLGTLLTMTWQRLRTGRWEEEGRSGGGGGFKSGDVEAPPVRAAQPQAQQMQQQQQQRPAATPGAAAGAANAAAVAAQAAAARAATMAAKAGVVAPAKRAAPPPPPPPHTLPPGSAIPMAPLRTAAASASASARAGGGGSGSQPSSPSSPAAAAAARPAAAGQTRMKF